MVRQRQVDWRSVANRKEGRTLLPEDQQLLTDQQLRDASGEQLQDLIARVDLLLRSKGQPGLTLHPPEDERDTPEPADPSDPLPTSAAQIAPAIATDTQNIQDPSGHTHARRAVRELPYSTPP